MQHFGALHLLRVRQIRVRVGDIELGLLVCVETLRHGSGVEERLLVSNGITVWLRVTNHCHGLAPIVLNEFLVLGDRRLEGRLCEWHDKLLYH